MRWKLNAIFTTLLIVFLVMHVSAYRQEERSVLSDKNPVKDLTRPIYVLSGTLSGPGLQGVQQDIEHSYISIPVQKNNQEVSGSSFLDQNANSAVKTYWVDPIRGNDRNVGTVRTFPFKTLTAAWNRIPKHRTLTGSIVIMLLPGDYRQEHIPGWMSGVCGSATAGITIQPVNGPHTARIHTPMDINTCRYLSLVNLDIVTDPGSSGGGNVLHISSSDHILVRGCTLSGKAGGERLPQETLKANQVRFLNVEGCDISGAFWYPLDYVAVQDGNITGSKIHDAGEFCMVIKGGSSRIRVERNQIYDGNTGAISAGSGTGFNWMVSPYLHYEIYDSKFVNNIIHHTGTVGISVNGGYNILFAFNTLYKTGSRDHLLEVMFGSRGCDGDAVTCEKYRKAGGWGTTGEGQYIPSAHVYIFNNIFYNPKGFQSRWNQFVVQGPVTPPVGSNVPSPSLADRDLRFKGNLIWNGPPISPKLPLFGDEGGCSSSNPTCNSRIVYSQNKINSLKPQFISPETGNFTPIRNGTIYRVQSVSIPAFSGRDRPKPPLAPGGDLLNTIPRDYYRKVRINTSPPGAVI